MEDCIFCKIGNGEIPSKKVYEDDNILAFHDLSPKAPVHVLIIPKKHIASLEETSDDDTLILGDLLVKIKLFAKELGLVNGYRLVSNCGKDGMQTVNHLHFHLMGKRLMQWPPG